MQSTVQIAKHPAWNDTLLNAPLIKLLIDQLQTHSPAPAEGSALRALKNTNDELARARQKLHDLGNPLTPVKNTGRSSAPAAPSHAPTPPPPKPPAITDVLQPPHTPPCKTTSPKAGTTQISNNGSLPLTPPSKKLRRKSSDCCKQAKSPRSS